MLREANCRREPEAISDTRNIKNTREFKKLRRLLHRKRTILKICLRLSVLQSFHVGYVVRKSEVSFRLLEET